jgi:hypothetical protein
MLAAMWSCRKQAWSSCYLASSVTTYVHNMTRRKESELQETKYSARYSKPPVSRPFPFQVSNNPLPLSLSYHFLYTKIGNNLHRIIGQTNSTGKPPWRVSTSKELDCAHKLRNEVTRTVAVDNKLQSNSRSTHGQNEYHTHPPFLPPKAAVINQEAALRCALAYFLKPLPSFGTRSVSTGKLDSQVICPDDDVWTCCYLTRAESR